jgi:hypothetical protein
MSLNLVLNVVEVTTGHLGPTAVDACSRHYWLWLDMKYHGWYLVWSAVSPGDKIAGECNRNQYIRKYGRK